MKNILLILTALILFTGCKIVKQQPHIATLSDIEPPDTTPCTNCPVNIHTNPGPWTNEIGRPIIRIISITGSATTNTLGSLLVTNHGFTIISNQVTTRYEKFAVTNEVKYFHITLGVINTDTNREYTILNWPELPFNPVFPIDSGWNGVGTNEHVHSNYIVIQPNLEKLFFLTRDLGPAL